MVMEGSFCGIQLSSLGCCAPFLCFCCNYWQKISFNWMRRRYSWRLAFFYRVLTAIAVVGVTLTLTLHFMIAGLSFFRNYRCGKRAISLLGINFILMMCIMGITGILCIMMARILDMFGNFSVAEFMSLGKWISRLGFMSKWGPWLVALLADCWFIVSFINNVWIFAAPEDWCSRRWNQKAVVAVDNCRMWYKGNVKCLNMEENDKLKASGLATTCNDGNELLSQKFFAFTPKSSDHRCSFSDILVCRAYSNLRTGNTVDWTHSPLDGCLGNVNVTPDDFHDSLTEKSDLYRYLMIYVQGWTIALITMACFFVYTKVSSKFDSLFFQPKSKHTNWLFRFGAPQTPFSA